MIAALIYLILVSSNGIVCSARPVASTPPREQFLAEAPKQWSLYAERASGLQMERKTWRQTKGGGRRDVEPYEHTKIRRNRSGTLLLWSYERQDGSCQCCVLNEAYSFQLRKKQSNADWVIAGVDRTHANGANAPYVDTVLHRNKGGVRAPGPFVLYMHWLPDLVKEPGFRVTSEHPVNRGDRALVQVHFVCARNSDGPNPLGTFHYKDGWLLLDPHAFWALREYEANVLFPTSQGITASAHGRIEYDATEGAFPLLSHAVVHVQGRSTNPAEPVVALDHEYVTEYVIEVKDPAPEEFTLAAFGFPEPPGFKKSIPLLAYAIGIGTACFVCAGILFWLRRRSVAR